MLDQPPDTHGPGGRGGKQEGQWHAFHLSAQQVDNRKLGTETENNATQLQASAVLSHCMQTNAGGETHCPESVLEKENPVWY